MMSLRGWSNRLAVGSLSRNGLFSLGQSLIVLGCTLLVYRLVVNCVGLERFGVWSLLLAGSSLARLGDLSGGGALSRFVAFKGQKAGHCPGNLRDLVHTVLLTSLALNGFLALFLLYLAPQVLPEFVAAEHLAEATALLPYAVATTILGALALATTSGIDGTQRADQRAMLVSMSSLLFLGSSALLLPEMGVIGFGVAQVLQQTSLLLGGWLVLQRHVPNLGWLPYRWKKSAFLETSGYALKMNAIGLTALLFEPLAKFAFNHAQGPGLVAIYELCSRLIVQIRGLALAAVTPLMPAFAARPGPEDPVFRQLLAKSIRLVSLAAMATAFLTLLVAPGLSYLVLGHLSSPLLKMNAALSAGWSLNILLVPLYFAAQAFDVQRWNFASHVLLSVSVLLGTFLLLPAFGVAGLIAAIVLGLGGCSLLGILGNSIALGTMDVLKDTSAYLLGSGIFILGCGLAVGWVV